MKALNHDSDTVLEMRNITKIYSIGFVANNDITFSVRRVRNSRPDGGKWCWKDHLDEGIIRPGKAGKGTDYLEWPGSAY